MPSNCEVTNLYIHVRATCSACFYLSGIDGSDIIATCDFRFSFVLRLMWCAGMVTVMQVPCCCLQHPHMYGEKSTFPPFCMNACLRQQTQAYEYKQMLQSLVEGGGEGSCVHNLRARSHRELSMPLEVLANILDTFADISESFEIFESFWNLQNARTELLIISRLS